MRKKVTLVFILVAVIMTIANFGLGYYFSRQSLMEAMEKNLDLSLLIADDLVSRRINALQTDARSIAEALDAILPGDISGAMREQLLRHPDFLTFTIFNGWDVEQTCGLLTADGYLLGGAGEKYLREAYSGAATMTTTYRDRTTSIFSMYVCVPMGEGRVLAATVDGMLFSQLLAPYVFWETGNIYMVDEDGKLLANIRDYLVEMEHNFVGAGSFDPSLRSIDESMRVGLADEGGVARYRYEGVERMAVYKPVGGAAGKWRIGVAAPLNECPAQLVQNALTFSSLLFFAVSVAAAVLLSGRVAKAMARAEDRTRGLTMLHAATEEASQSKTNFLANMSHEMRTPLNTVICLSELLLCEGKVEGEEYEAVEKIHGAGELMLGIVDDIVDISKIEAGKLELADREYDFANLINDVATQNMLRIGDKQIIFTLFIDELLPARLFGDRLRVQKILDSLLSNAVKHTMDGTIELHISYERDGADPQWLWIKAVVKDTGVGIKPEDIPKLFTKYSQIHTKANCGMEGTGIGLAIVKAEAELMGGSVEVESEFGKGSTFTARIRQRCNDEAAAGRGSDAHSQKIRSYTCGKLDRHRRLSRVRIPGARVLVVDDVHANLDVARGMMRKYGMQIDCVTSGFQAVEAVREEKVRYNAIFMDHVMPGMDGIEAVRAIREEVGTPYARSVPIIALTAHALVGAERMFLDNGFQAYVSKPIDAARLDAVIKRWVRDSGEGADAEPEPYGGAAEVVGAAAEGGGAAAEAVGAAAEDGGAAAEAVGAAAPSQCECPPAAPAQCECLPAAPATGDDNLRWSGLAGSVEGLDYARGVGRFCGDEEAYIEVLRSYAANTLPLVEMALADAEGSLESYAITVHGIKGSSRGVCADAVGDAAEALERAAREGDRAYIAANNEDFAKLAMRLIEGVNDALRRVDEILDEAKPVADAPDAALLARLRDACLSYAADDVDAALQELGRFRYLADGSFIDWLKERANGTEYTEMAERLSEWLQRQAA